MEDKAIVIPRAAQQFNGRKGETATLLSRCLFNSNGLGGGFAPRHLNLSVLLVLTQVCAIFGFWCILVAMETNLIETNPAVMMGKPVVAGTRITVELILEKLAAGETVEQILDAHPCLTRQAISAALLYAVQNLPTFSPKAV